MIEHSPGCKAEPVLAGKVALVTGASKGIGRAIAERFAAAGADLVVNYHTDRSGAEAVAEAARTLGRRAVTVKADVGNAAEVDRLVVAIRHEFSRLDVLVNNAAVTMRHTGTFLDLPREAWERVVQVNLNGLFYCTQMAARIMAETGGGAIVNVSSVHSIITSASGKATAYPATKAAINMFTKSVAVELAAYGIRVNAVAPGLVVTPVIGNHSEPMLRAYRRRIPLGRAGEPAEIAEAVLFLASPASSYITGSTLLVDGGYAADGTLTEVRHAELT